MIRRSRFGVPALGLAALLPACAARHDSLSSGPAGDGSSSLQGGSETPRSPSIKPWTYAGRPGRLIETEHYAIHTTDTSSVVVDRLPMFLEAAHSRYVAAFGPLPAGPTGNDRMDVFVMATRAEWQRLSRELLGSQAEPILRMERGGFTSGGRALFFNIGTADTLAIASHEGWHLFTQRTFARPLPTWAEEGIATHFEGYRWSAGASTFHSWSNIERFDQLRAAAQAGGLIPLERLLTMQPSGVIEGSQRSTLTYYAQVWALIHFLEEGDGGSHRAALKALIADAAGGSIAEHVRERFAADALGARPVSATDGAAIFRAYFGSDLASIAKRYRDFINSITGPGVRGAIVEGRSPLRESHR
ncbi:MAG: hypothetical protein JNM07_06720 [Phycisphaerae bacterium]|nr:hypothetical protein [Phycisphaerae bacterium]